MLTSKQKKACERLLKALDNCQKHGLQGGVYDRNFCVWAEKDNSKLDFFGGKFFIDVEENGEILPTKMYLDGGAGV